MRIEREKIARLLERLMGRNERERGMQPLLVLGCFYDLGVSDDFVCASCRNYETCRPYLKGFFEDDSLFGRND